MVVDTGEQPTTLSADLPGDHQIAYRQRGDLRANVSAARNAGVRECQSKFVLILDDDQEFTSDKTLPAMLDVLKSDAEIAAVTATMVQGGKLIVFARDIQLSNGTMRLVKAQRPERTTPGGTVYRPCNATWSGCILARRETWLSHPWDESIPTCVEAEDWWLAMQAAGLLLATCPEVMVLHWPGGDAGYTKERQRDYRPQLKEKWNINRVVAVG